MEEVEGWDYNDSFKPILDDDDSSSSSDSDSEDEETDVDVIDSLRGMTDAPVYKKIVLTEEELLPEAE
jgi:hypothetical protein